MKAVRMPKTVSGVKSGLTGLVKQTFEKAIEQPAQIADEVVSGVLGGPKSNPKPKADPAFSSRLKQAQKTQDLEELNRIRAEIGQDGSEPTSGRGRDVEKEIAQVRAEKKRLQDAKEEEFLRQLAEQKRQEEEAMSADAYYEPPGKKKRGSAFARNIKKSSGTKEMGKGGKD
ncbi:MAG: hypothetical protein ABID04_00525 [Patescibacteria group bacterium]